MTGPQDMDFIVSGVDPSDPTWNKMARIRWLNSVSYLLF
jgi:hypothetical protein